MTGLVDAPFRTGRQRPRKWTAKRLWRLAELVERGKSDAAAARALGETEHAVKMARIRAGILPVSRQHESAGEVATLMGFAHGSAIARWIRHGWIKAYKAGRGVHGTWQVRRIDLERFLADPDHWHRWDVEQITDRALRRYAETVRGDVRYLTTPEVAERLYVGQRAVAEWIRAGLLPARKDGNHWKVLESDARRVYRAVADPEGRPRQAPLDRAPVAPPRRATRCRLDMGRHRRRPGPHTLRRRVALALVTREESRMTATTAEPARIVKCWMFIWNDGECCNPGWGATEEHARAAFDDRYPGLDCVDAIRIPAWDDREPDSITAHDWYALDAGYGPRCAICGEPVYKEAGHVWWTLDGKPIHGPDQDEDCWWDVRESNNAVSAEVYDYIESLRHALRFYANADNWRGAMVGAWEFTPDTEFTSESSEWRADMGDVARKALEERT